MSTNEQEKFNQWWESKGVNSVILRAQAWSAWLARAEAEQPQQAEQWPKYYKPSHECRTADGKPVAFFKMRGVDDGETFHTDGTSFRWSEWVSDLAPIEITEAEALALLQKPKQCAVGCHGPRCPNPALPGKDYCSKCVKPEAGQLTVNDLIAIGKAAKQCISHDEHRGEWRCKNAALPGKDHCSECADEEPQPPKKTRVRLWVSQSAVIVRDANSKGFGKEIHHDSEGFYYTED